MNYFWKRVSTLCLTILILFIELPYLSANGISNCSFVDTVNLTSAIKYNNGSYLYRDILIPETLVGIYDYIEIKDGQRITVEQHVRGCACKIKSCIKLCCDPNYVYEDEVCTMNVTTGLDELPYSAFINVTLNNGTTKLIHVINEFTIQISNPCAKNNFFLIPELDESDSWNLFENGTLLRHFDHEYLSQHEYCFAPGRLNDTFILNPVNCLVEQLETANLYINTYALLFSIPFFILTIIVYMIIPRLRNLHGKCLICYLIFLTIGSIIIIYLNIKDKGLETSHCTFWGYVCYFNLMSAFSWLSVISFDMWYSFGGINRAKQRFRYYFVYALILPTILTSITWVAQNTIKSDDLNPNIGKMHCWFNPENWTSMIYFYNIILIILILNTIIYISTFKKIINIKRNLKQFSAREKRNRRLSDDKQNFGLFLRLFIVMGITWIFEIISFIVGTSTKYQKFFYITDILNALQGAIIFVLFVMKRKVWKLLKQRIFNSDESTVSADSARSDISAEEMTLKSRQENGVTPE